MRIATKTLKYDNTSTKVELTILIINYSYFHSSNFIFGVYNYHTCLILKINNIMLKLMRNIQGVINILYIM